MIEGSQVWRLRFLLLLSCLGAWAACAEVGPVAVGQPLPSATLRALNGPPRNLEMYRGRPLIINVWASWCGPCQEEMASLERLAWRDDGRAFAIIGISTDDDPAPALAFLKRTRATISQFIDSGRQWEGLLGASRIPLTVLVDGRGRILRRVYGSQQWDSPEILKLLNSTFGAHKLRQTRTPVFPQAKGDVQGLLR